VESLRIGWADVGNNLFARYATAVGGLAFR
jgi:hypothetical protein